MKVVHVHVSRYITHTICITHVIVCQQDFFARLLIAQLALVYTNHYLTNSQGKTKVGMMCCYHYEIIF